MSERKLSLLERKPCEEAIAEAVRKAREDEARKCAADVCELCRRGIELVGGKGLRWYHVCELWLTCKATPIHERLLRESQERKK